MLSLRDTFQIARHDQVESKGSKGHYTYTIANNYKKGAGVAILILDKLSFKTKHITGEKKIF